MKDIFIVGSKGIPAKYGGFETFVDELVTRRKNSDIRYHVACMNSDKDYLYNCARCFNVTVPNIGPAKAVLYDIKALKEIIKYIEINNLSNGIVYVLACRIGPFFKRYVTKLHRLGFEIYVNPDGHEWMRSKWNYLIKKYWKLSEKLMVKNADLLICDSVNIENYIKNEYKVYNPKTTYIAYGADTTLSNLKDTSPRLKDWYEKFDLEKKKYYLIVGRFVPENNYEVIIKEFMKSNTSKDLVIITNIEKNKFYEKLKMNTKFENDSRIKFVGTVYDKELIKKIRENAYGYFHGHEVGGTNPSLLEALASTDLNLLLDVGFNREVAGENGAIYWTKEKNDLAEKINMLDTIEEKNIIKLSDAAKTRINEKYSWDRIVSEYEGLFK